MCLSNNLKNIKFIIRKIKYILKDFFYKDYIKLSWDKGTNFGDAINPILVEKLTHKKVCWVHRLYYHKTYLMCIGSILQKANSNAIIWGTGLISADSILEQIPQKICAVRGPRTRKRLLELDIDCPNVYGDPALLLPFIYDPKIKIKYKLGIIPHYVDKENPFLYSFSNNPEILIINIKNKNHFEFIDLLLSCEKIVSSSLHGIIVSDAYKIPAMWIEFSDNVKGNGFKFLDYFESVNRIDNKAYRFTEKTTLEDLLNLFYEYKIEIDLNKLIQAFPYSIEIKKDV